MATPVKPGLTLIPLLQHFIEYSGNEVNTTAARLIAIQTLSNEKWFKTDLKVPYDWENETWPTDIELQLGKSFTSTIGSYIDLQAGIGSDRPYDWAVGAGLRINY